MKEYKFNDYPFNMMNWVNGNTIEAVFHVGNPKKGDIIIYNSKKLGLLKYVITSYEYKHDLYFLLVNPL